MSMSQFDCWYESLEWDNLDELREHLFRELEDRCSQIPPPPTLPAK